MKSVISKLGLVALMIGSALAASGQCRTAVCEKADTTQSKGFVERTYDKAADGTVKVYKKVAKGTVKGYREAADWTEKSSEKVADGTVDTYNKAKDGTVNTYNKVKGAVKKVF